MVTAVWNMYISRSSRRLLRRRWKLLDTHSAAIRSSPLYTYRRRYHLRHPPTDRTLGSRPHIVRYGRYRRMYPCVPGPLLRTPGCQLQFPVICLSSGPASFPSLHHILCPKREEMLVSDIEFDRFNTFYSAFSTNSAKIWLCCCTFGTLFADTFSEQSNCDI